MADRDLTTGPVWRALAVMSAPMSLGILAVLSVGIADAYFLGQLGGAPLAAVGFIYPVTIAVTSLSIGLSAGANTVVSNAIGAGDGAAKAGRLALHALGLGVGLAVAVAFAVWAATGPLFTGLGASDTVMVEIRAFMPWWALSFPCVVLTMLVNALFRAHGDATVSAAFMGAEAVLNIALTPLLIFGWGFVPGFDTAGAAMATFIARALIATVSLAYAVQKGLIAPGRTPFDNLWPSVRDIGRVGAPAAFSNAINPAGMALVTMAVATLGEATVGGFGAATRIQQLALVPMLALSAGIAPVVGQNWGAERRGRAALSLKYAFGFCLGYSVLVGLLLTLLATPLAALFAEDETAVSSAATYLRWIGWSLFGYGFVITANAAMNARSKAAWSMGLSLARILAVYLPGAWIGVMVFGYAGIVGAAVIANVLAAAGAVWVAHRNGVLTWGLGDLRGGAPARPAE